jgi:hypothetical protein
VIIINQVFIFIIGLKSLKKNIKQIKAEQYSQSDPKSFMPWVEQWEIFYDKKSQFNRRRMRILMRGVKIGQKQLMAVGKMSIFDTKRKTTTAKV